MDDGSIVFLSIAILFGAAGYVFYFRSIFAGYTKPHVFTWVIYTIIDAIVFAAQITHGGGIGSWVIGISTLCNFGITLLAMQLGTKVIRSVDWGYFIAALFAIVLWQTTGNALTAVVIATILNGLALLPTVRKAYARPLEESISVWTFDIVKFVAGAMSLGSITLTTALFPLGAATMNALFVIMVMLRRRMIHEL